METTLAFNRNDASFLDSDPLEPPVTSKKRQIELDEDLEGKPPGETPAVPVEGREKLTKEQKDAFTDTLFKKGGLRH